MDRPVDPVEFADDLLEELGALFLVGVVTHELHDAANPGQWILDLVCEARRQPAEGCESISVVKLITEGLSLFPLLLEDVGQGTIELGGHRIEQDAGHLSVGDDLRADRVAFETSQLSERPAGPFSNTEIDASHQQHPAADQENGVSPKTVVSGRDLGGEVEVDGHRRQHFILRVALDAGAHRPNFSDADQGGDTSASLEIEFFFP